MVQTRIQLTEKQDASLKRLAVMRHLSVAELIRQAVDAAIQEGPFIDLEEKKKRALAIAGQFRSGKRDISKAHDKCLVDVYGNRF